MHELITLLQSIPDVIWSGVIASVLTLSGLLISNRSNTKRLKLQLQHDANEKAKERTAALRRETYLRMAEELVKANAYLASLPQADLSRVNAGEALQGFAAAAARLQLVAEPKTALLVNQLAARYAELLFTLMGLLIPLGRAKTDIGIADDLYTKAQAEINRLVSEMTKQNESGQPNAQTFATLRTNFEFQQAQSAQRAVERGEAWDRFNNQTILFQRRLLTEMRELGARQIPVMVEIRRDLGLTGDLSEIEDFMKQQWSRMEGHFDTLIAALKDGQPALRGNGPQGEPDASLEGRRA